MKKCKFKRNDIVSVTNADHCYISYSQLIKRNPWYMLRWAYKVHPNNNHKFKILKVCKHVMEDKYDKCKWAIIIQDTITKQIFVIGELGLKS